MTDIQTLPAKDQYVVAVVGATGMVGETMRDILEERQFPIGQLRLMASERSAGEKVRWHGQSITVENLDDADFAGVDIALFSAGGSISEKHAPRAAAAGAVVIDNTSFFRRDEDVPLIVTEVNPGALNHRPKGIIANPNCSTMQMMVALAPIHRQAGIEEIHVSTYQAVSGAGRSGAEELGRQTAAMLNFKDIESEKFSAQIAFNVLAEIDSYQENGFTREEMKMVWETHRILGDEDIRVIPTCVRVPVFSGHAMSVHFKTRRDITLEQVKSLLQQADGLIYCDSGSTHPPVTPVTHAAGKDPVYVSRLRHNGVDERGFCLWVVADNIRKGAALNAVQIAEKLIKS